MVIQDRRKKFQEALDRNPHLAGYLERWSAEGNKLPEFYPQLQSDMAKLKEFNFLYPVGDPMFIHVYKIGASGKRYVTIEPSMSEETLDRFERIQQAILKEAPYERPHESKEEFAALLERLMRRVTTFKESPVTGWLSSRISGFETKKILISERELETIKYYMIRNIIEHGPLEPIIRDPFIEDIHSIGTADLYIVHKVFGMMATNVKFRDAAHLDEFLRTMSERIGKPVSDAKPIIDGALPDGSRINIVYSEDVSKKGSSFTIRKFSEKPFTVTALIKFGTLNTEIAAYIWLCLENGMSVIVSGETASGKTTTLNAILTFINHNQKVYSAEDTPEVIAPQPVWQRLITRDVGPEGSRVELFDLVRAALRSRPNYIVVGEVRGKEGSVMFQAMQTGHSVLSTFHAPSTNPEVHGRAHQRANKVHGQPERRGLPVLSLRGREAHKARDLRRRDKPLLQGPRRRSDQVCVPLGPIHGHPLLQGNEQLLHPRGEDSPEAEVRGQEDDLRRAQGAGEGPQADGRQERRRLRRREQDNGLVLPRWWRRGLAAGAEALIPPPNRPRGASTNSGAGRGRGRPVAIRA